MRISLLLPFVFVLFSSFLLRYDNQGNYYDSDLVEITNSDQYTMITMAREGDRVKAKYFAAEDYNGRSVYSRYTEWARGRNTIVVSSGTYMDNCNLLMQPKPVGLCIDNGKVVNNQLSSDFDGLVIVYATGGIVVSNLDEGNLSVVWEGQKVTFDLRNNYWHRSRFIDWAEEHYATVFQTHLLVYDNVLTTYRAPNCESCQEKRERRFLAVCNDEYGKLMHVIINSPTYESIYDATSNVYSFLINFKDMEEVFFMINLDTGCQDVIEARDDSGNVIPGIKGRNSISTAVNLLTYYYE